MILLIDVSDYYMFGHLYECFHVLNRTLINTAKVGHLEPTDSSVITLSTITWLIEITNFKSYQNPKKSLLYFHLVISRQCINFVNSIMSS